MQPRARLRDHAVTEAEIYTHTTHCGITAPHSQSLLRQRRPLEASVGDGRCQVVAAVMLPPCRCMQPVRHASVAVDHVGEDWAAVAEQVAVSVVAVAHVADQRAALVDAEVVQGEDGAQDVLGRRQVRIEPPPSGS